MSDQILFEVRKLAGKLETPASEPPSAAAEVSPWTNGNWARVIILEFQYAGGRQMLNIYGCSLEPKSVGSQPTREQSYNGVVMLLDEICAAGYSIATCSATNPGGGQILTWTLSKTIH